MAAAVLASLSACGLARADDFFMGSDISLLSWEQSEGMTFANTNGVAGLADQILYNNGDNLFRLRVFVNPNTSYSATDGAIQTTAYDIALAQQIKTDDPSAKFELDFHYSDTWADPGDQTIPSAWTNHSLAGIESSIQSYTTSTLQSFEAAGVTPDIVQVGNEINNGMDWNTTANTPPDTHLFQGTTAQQNTEWQNFGGVVNAAIAGVHAAQITGANKMQVSVVIAQGNSNGEPQYFFSELTNPSLGNVPLSSFDIMGVDYYPTTTNDMPTMQTNLTALANTYNKKIMVMETDAPWQSTSVGTDPTYPDTPAGQENYLTALASMVRGLPNNDGMGLLYWYPESVQVPGQFDYNGGSTALFNSGTPHVATQGIQAFSAAQNQWANALGTGNWSDTATGSTTTSTLSTTDTVVVNSTLTDIYNVTTTTTTTTVLSNWNNATNVNPTATTLNSPTSTQTSTVTASGKSTVTYTIKVSNTVSSAPPPNSIGAEADFLSSGTGSQTVLISSSSPVTLGTLKFDTPMSYTIGGTGSLTLQEDVGSANVVVQEGTEQINVPTTIASNSVFTVSSGASLQISAPITVNTGLSLAPAGSGTVGYSSTINVSSGASMSIGNSTHAAGLTIGSGGNVALTGTGTLFETDNFSNSGTIDLQTNALLINYGTGTDPAGAIRTELLDGYAGGTWAGIGIISSAAADSGGSYGVGYVDGNDNVLGTPVSSGTIEVAYALYGDANLDGKVDITDFNIFAPNFGLPTTLGWEAGDFNYSGAVDIGDFNLFAGNFGLSSNGTAVNMPAADYAALDAFAAANGLSLTSVPEPTSAALAVAMASSILAMRRRKA